MAIEITGANRHDMKKLAEVLDAVMVAPAPSTESHLALDHGYDYEACRTAATEHG